MPTIQVNGDLEHAIAVFRRKTISEGILWNVQNKVAYIPPHELRAKKAYRLKQRKRLKEMARRKK